MTSPRSEKLNALSEFLATIGIKLAKGQVLKPMQFNDILAKVRGTEHENVVNEIVLRTQAQAEYVAENYGHFGLHLRRYAHFTSPIRRYADLIVHRALVRALDLGPGGLPEMGREHLAEIAARISAAERRAMAAERETTDRLIATFLAEQIGAQFRGPHRRRHPRRAVRQARRHRRRRLCARGARSATIISAYDEAHHALIGSRTGETYPAWRCGDGEAGGSRAFRRRPAIRDAEQGQARAAAAPARQGQNAKARPPRQDRYGQ